MSEHKVTLTDCNLKDLVSTGGTPLEDLPIGAAEKEAALLEAARINVGGPTGGGRWVCFGQPPALVICHWVHDLKPPPGDD